MQRQKSGGYKIDFEIDPDWLKRQRQKVKNSKNKVIIVIADKFAEIVYDCKFPLEEKRSYKKIIENELIGQRNFSKIYFELEAIERFWDIRKYMQIVACQNIDRVESEAEMERRKNIYNPDKYSIEKDELRNMAKTALACFKTEEILESKMS